MKIENLELLVETEKKSKMDYKASAIQNEIKLIQTLNDLEEMKSQHILSPKNSKKNLSASPKLKNSTSMQLRHQEQKDTCMDFTHIQGLDNISEAKVKS